LLLLLLLLWNSMIILLLVEEPVVYFLLLGGLLTITPSLTSRAIINLNLSLSRWYLSWTISTLISCKRLTRIFTETLRSGPRLNDIIGINKRRLILLVYYLLLALDVSPLVLLVRMFWGILLAGYLLVLQWVKTLLLKDNMLRAYWHVGGLFNWKQ
jgi:hypothetical protein